MTIQEMVYQFQLQAELVDTKRVQSLGLPKIIIILNSGMLNLIKQKYGLNNGFRAGFETIEKRRQDLQRLHVPNEKLPGEESTSNNLEIEFDLLQTEQPLLFITRTQFLASKDGCKNKILDGISLETDDANSVLRDPFTGPSFEWRETVYRVMSDKLVVETDGTFTLTQVTMDYLRYPVKMDIVGYKHFGNTGIASTNVDCELPEFLHPEIVDQAALEFKLWTQDPNYQFAQLKKALDE